MNQRAKTTVKGIVQGVGFRPFICRLARRHALKGFVSNTGRGVELEIEGDAGRIEDFFRDIPADKPPLAVITDIETEYLAPNGYDAFVIRRSHAETGSTALITPDTSVCSDCLAEMADPGDRRHGYPFINCTNCGPRYTIIRNIPYDREKTTMAAFQMCAACRQEYEDPGDRRFHAQPNACPDCGPQVWLHDHAGEVIESPDPVAKTRELLLSGKVVAVKGIGGFHLAVNALDDDAVERLRRRKHREEKPLALMSGTIGEIREYARVSSAEEWALQSLERPIVLLGKKEAAALSEAVAPGNRDIGAMLPYTPLHHLLLSDDLKTIVLTSGNASGDPITVGNEEAFTRLSGIADAFLVHDRDIYIRNDDSVVRVVDDRVRMVRRSRGYAPAPIPLSAHVRPTLACGPFLSNTICIARGDEAFLSQHVGDLESLEASDSFEMTVEHLKRVLEIDPLVVAYDLHPDYVSTRYALSLNGVELVGVQHHHAHIAACMAENGLSGPVIGLAMDGSGYGPDGTIWGGEILVADYAGFSRAGHFRTVVLPGGEKAIEEPWRTAVAYLHEIYGRGLFDLDIEFVQSLDPSEGGNIVAMIEKGINCPKTSSCGRLFDAVAALIRLRDRVSFRGQAAVELEMVMGEGDDGSYSFEINREDGLVVDCRPIIRGIVADLAGGVDGGTISRRFHNSLVRALTGSCRLLRDETRINRVAMSGGVFQNTYLLGALERALAGEGFEVHTHSRVPTNDGGISLGQALVANAVLDVGQQEREV